jgi:hypothetical protein
LANYCRKFVDGLSIICKPLYELLKKEVDASKFKEFIEKDKIIKCFEKIKEKISEETLLGRPVAGGKYILTTDASNIGVGAVLSQIQDNKEVIISFYSAIHNKAQKNYSTTDQELLAVISAMDHFRYFLLGNNFILKTDHMALLYLLRTRNFKSRLMRWALRLQEYDFTVEHIKGTDNFTDILSRAFICSEVLISKNSRKLIVPVKGDEIEIMREFHHKTGHGGIDTMKYLILRKYSWKNARKDINLFVKNCEICAKELRYADTKSVRVLKVEGANEKYEIDLIGPLEKSENGNVYVMTVIDIFNKRGAALPIKNKLGCEIAKKLGIVFKVMGFPKIILTDNGREYVNSNVEDFCRINKILIKHGSPYCPTTTGAVERYNQTLMRKLKKICLFGKLDWESKLQDAVEA